MDKELEELYEDLYHVIKGIIKLPHFTENQKEGVVRIDLFNQYTGRSHIYFRYETLYDILKKIETKNEILIGGQRNGKKYKKN